jgi:hypothetical protein
MMGIEERTFQPLPENVALEALLPKYNLYRRLETTIDLSCTSTHPLAHPQSSILSICPVVAPSVAGRMF